MILPGVGSFPAGMKKLKDNKLDQIIKKFIKTKKPVLAICLGYQMLFSSSNEFQLTKGLNKQAIRTITIIKLIIFPS